MRYVSETVDKMLLHIPEDLGDLRARLVELKKDIWLELTGDYGGHWGGLANILHIHMPMPTADQTLKEWFDSLEPWERYIFSIYKGWPDNDREWPEDFSKNPYIPGYIYKGHPSFETVPGEEHLRYIIGDGESVLRIQDGFPPYIQGYGELHGDMDATYYLFKFIK